MYYLYPDHRAFRKSGTAIIWIIFDWLNRMSLRNLLRVMKPGNSYTNEEKTAIAQWFKNNQPVNKKELEYQRAIQEQLGVKVPGVNKGYFPMGAKIGGRRKHSTRSKRSKRTTRRHKK